jgi:hypothetical protein
MHQDLLPGVSPLLFCPAAMDTLSEGAKTVVTPAGLYAVCAERQ